MIYKYLFFISSGFLGFSVLLNIVLGAVLKHKNKQEFDEHLIAETEKEIIVRKINSKTKEEIKELDKDVKKAKDFNSIKHTIIDKLFD
jgi:uncharacterized protein YlxW (UPF0749 family)